MFLPFGDDAEIGGGRFRIYRVTPPWDTSLGVYQGETPLWRPRLRNDEEDPPVFVHVRAVGTTLALRIEHGAGAAVRYVWCQGQEATGYQANVNGTTTDCRLSLFRYAEPS